TTLLAIFFNTLNLFLLVPLLHVLFNTSDAAAVVYDKPENIWNIMDNFNYYTQYINNEFCTYCALQFVCAIIIASVFLSNLFRYISQRIMENLRVHTLLNMRRAVFNS